MISNRFRTAGTEFLLLLGTAGFAVRAFLESEEGPEGREVF
jgi:hypothetical protein